MKEELRKEELIIASLTEEQQKEYNYIDGKIRRRSPVYPHEHYRWGELREEAEKKRLDLHFNKNKL